MLLLYHTSMSSKDSGDWNEFDYKTQVIPLGFLLWIWGAEGSSGSFGGRCLGLALLGLTERRCGVGTVVLTSGFGLSKACGRQVWAAAQAGRELSHACCGAACDLQQSH